VPYHPSFEDGIYDAQPKHKEVALSLTERLRERESEVRLLRQENWELQNQLRLRGNPINLDVAYEDLLAHLKEREANFHSESMEHAERQRNLEKEIRKLKDKSHASRKLLDDQEMQISLMEKEGEDQHKHILSIKEEANNELSKMQKQLDAVVNDNNEKHLRIVELLNEADHGKQREIEDQEMLARLADRIDNHAHDRDNLERINEDLQRRLEIQRHLLREKEDEILHRENMLSDDLNRMSYGLNEIIETQQKNLQDQEEIIHFLYQKIDRYQAIIDDADYVTQEQRNEIKSLSTEIERVQNSGFLSQLDKMLWCGSKSIDNSTRKSLLDSA